MRRPATSTLIRIAMLVVGLFVLSLGANHYIEHQRARGIEEAVPTTSEERDSTSDSDWIYAACVEEFDSWDDHAAIDRLLPSYHLAAPTLR